MNFRLNEPTCWNLNNLYPEPKETALSRELDELEVISHPLLHNMKHPSTSNLIKPETLSLLFQLIRRIEKADSYYYCLSAETPRHTGNTLLYNRISTLKAGVRSLRSDLGRQLSLMTDEQFADWSILPAIRPFLSDLLTLRKNCQTLPSDLEDFATKLAGDGLKALEHMYIQLRNKLQIYIADGVHETKLSFGEANRIALSDPNPDRQKQVFQSLKQTLEQESDLFASVLNQITNLRLALCHAQKRKDVLDESLELSGLSRDTLDTMWGTIDSLLPKLTRYLTMKATEYGQEKISWHQLKTQSHVSTQIPFPEAMEQIVQTSNQLDPAMGDFIHQAAMNGWIDAVPSKHKQLGGFCAPFISDGESRISLHYDGSVESGRILAHELGHAWHFRQLEDSSSIVLLEDRFSMTIAETSSIFFQLRFVDDMIQNSKDREEKKALLSWKIQDSLIYVMGIRAAYLFETQLYEKRSSGPLNARQLEDIFIETQRKSYGDQLSEYQPFEWIKAIQFYRPYVPFYNYPYTYGYLFSLGLVEVAKQDGKQFAKNFNQFLRETGKKSVEDLSLQHFNINLSHPDFWHQSIQRIVDDIEEYIHLSTT
ncbi:Oligoendopeptidase F [Thermoactinomyces sp. DSM 45891]|uniref:M3 family metallopeptidase n=1 Tax=Thermoactinomyces sp. DSM 45891 TaxID=1761907 RepID=UPI00090EEA83|nr:M3 family metallopeptidase [Thermoactinomyces sp. DSM 45891]SFX33150.1 Oligoendopeptidase F [Thermoactinomyces sp. DSM 45891]